MGTIEFEGNTMSKVNELEAESKPNKNMPDNIFIRVQDHFRKIFFRDILYIESSGSYSDVYLRTGPKITVAYTIAEIMRHLSDCLFIRIHRSFIVNQAHVTGYFGNILYIDKYMIPIGRQYKKDVLTYFNILGKID